MNPNPESQTNEEYNSITGLIQTIKSIKNPFLFDEIKEMVTQWCSSLQKQKDSLNPPQYFPSNIKNKLKLIEQTAKISKNQSYKTIILQQIQQIAPVQKKLWPQANLLINLNSIKKLPNDSINKLISHIYKLKQTKHLIGFLNQLVQDQKINKQQFEKQIAQIQLEEQNGFDLQTIIQEIFESKPNSKSIFQRITENINNLDIFKDKIFRSTSQDGQVQINGKINKITKDKKIIKLVISSQDLEKNVQIKYQNYIEQIKATYNQKTQLGSLINNKYQKLLKQKLQNKYLMQDVKLEHNPKSNCSIKNIIKPGVYKIRKGKQFNFSNGHYLYFQQKSGKQIQFLVYTDKHLNLKDFQIKQKQKQHKVLFRNFIKSFQVVKQIQQTIKYNEQNLSNNSISIDDPSQQDYGATFLQKLNQINNKKQKIMDKLKSNQDYKELFGFLLKQILQNSGQLNWESQKFQKQFLKKNCSSLLQTEIQQLRNIYIQLKDEKAYKEIIQHIVELANYTQLIDKNNTINTVRITNSFIESQKSLQNMKDKEITFICGCTGSGKSTSVNYFMGVPLKKFENSVGELAIKIDQQKYAIKKDQPASKIGQSIGTSQTIYSQGYRILQNTITDKQLINRINSGCLCDNPGFNDTRGSEYQIVTNLSIDRAIKICKSVKSIVLVVPFQAFTLDRANHLIQIINVTKQRFPNLQNIQNFYILITKWQSDQQRLKFQARLLSHINEQNKRIKELSKQNQNQKQHIQYRLNIYKFLHKLYKNSKIDFIKVTNQIQRKKILKKYLNNQSNINKNQYKNSMQGNDQKNFSDQISICTNTWSDHILKPYFQDYPNLIDQNKQKIQENKSKLLKIQDNIKKDNFNLQKHLKQVKQLNQLIKKTEQQYNRFLKGQNYFNDAQKRSIQNSQDISQQLKSKIQKIKLLKKPKLDLLNKNFQQLKQKKQKKQKRLSQYKMDLLKFQKQINIKQKNNQQLKNKINQWSEGYQTEILVKQSYQINKIIKVGRKCSTKEQRDILIKQFKTFEIQQTYDFKIGQKQSRLVSIAKIDRDYIILPNSKKFDPNNYLKNVSGTYGKYKTNLKSQNVVLQNANLSPDGKILMISYIMQFKKTQDSKELPYLQISHDIPKQQIYCSQINKSEGQIEANLKFIQNFEQKINQKNKQISYQSKQLINTQQKIKTQQKYIDEIKQQIQGMIQIQRKNHKQTNRQKIIQNMRAEKKQQIQNKKRQLERINKQIQTLKQSIKKNEFGLIQINKIIIQKQKKLNQLLFKHKRYALLIKWQLKKQVPQALQKFISIAYQFGNQFIKNKQDSFKKAQILKKADFERFITIYQKYKSDLEAKVTSHLSQKN